MTTVTTNYSSTTDSTALTITLASLASSATLVAGRESTAVDNTSNLYVDAILSGQITTGTSPTADKYIEVWFYAPLKVASSTFTYPVATTTALTGANAAATFELNQKYQLVLASAVSNIGTSDRKYAIGPISVASAFGGIMPLKWGIFVTHSTGVNLNSTAGNHWMHYTGIKYDSA